MELLGIPFLGMEPKEMKSLSRRGICPLVFIAASFTVAKTQQELKCLSLYLYEWIRKMSYVYIMEYSSALKRKESQPFATS